MKRHESLHPLSVHHHHVLVQALEIRRAAAESGPARAARLRQAAESLIRFWEESGQVHFREEEEELLPAYARHLRLDADADITRMLADHALIRASMQDLKASLGTDQFQEAAVIRLGQLLHEHVRLEEDKIFPKMEATLDEKELSAVGHHLTRLHGQCELP